MILDLREDAMEVSLVGQLPDCESVSVHFDTGLTLYLKPETCQSLLEELRANAVLFGGDPK